MGQKQNIGELADGSLRHLTYLEEIIGDLERGRCLSGKQIHRANEAVREVQENNAEIRDRFESQVGPI